MSELRQELVSVASPRLLAMGSAHELRWIVDHCLRVSHAKPDEAQTLLQDVLRRREASEPLAYILGSWSFRDYEFHVGSGVLIPRPETEELVEAVLKTIHNSQRTAEHLVSREFRIADFGAGSGCLGLSVVLDLLRDVAREGEDADKVSSLLRLDLVENSPQALPWLRRNVDKYSKELRQVRVSVVDQSWASYAPATPVDLLVSNPPYVTPLEYEQVEASVKLHEPKSALLPSSAGTDPQARSCYVEIFNVASKVMSPGAWLWFELGTQQGSWIKEHAMAHGAFNDARTMRDLSHKVRFFCARRNEAV